MIQIKQKNYYKKTIMRDSVLLTSNYILLFTSVFMAMFAFVMGANAESQPMKENWALVILLAELCFIYSIISLFINKNK